MHHIEKNTKNVSTYSSIDEYSYSINIEQEGFYKQNLGLVISDTPY